MPIHTFFKLPLHPRHPMLFRLVTKSNHTIKKNLLLINKSKIPILVPFNHQTPLKYTDAGLNASTVLSPFPAPANSGKPNPSALKLHHTDPITGSISKPTSGALNAISPPVWL